MTPESEFNPDMNAPRDVVVEATPVNVAAPRKPRIWTVFATWFAAAFAGQVLQIGACVVVGVVMGVMLGAQGKDANAIQVAVQEFIQRPLPGLLLSLVPFQLGMLAVVYFAARRSATPTAERLGLLPTSSHHAARPRAAMLAAFTLSTALASIIALGMILGGPPANTPISSALGSGSWWVVTIAGLVLSIIPALVEELLFRGYIQRRLAERWSPTAAIGVTTFLFAILHADSLQHILAVIPLGVITGLLAHRTGSVKPGMLLHAIHNVGAVAFAALTTALAGSVSDEMIGLLTLFGIALLGVVGAPAVFALVRNRKVSEEATRSPFAAFDHVASGLLVDSSLSG